MSNNDMDRHMHMLSQLRTLKLQSMNLFPNNADKQWRGKEAESNGTASGVSDHTASADGSSDTTVKVDSLHGRSAHRLHLGAMVLCPSTHILRNILF